MHDFLTGNIILIADFMFAQPVSYTYSCVKTGVYTWILYQLETRKSVIYCNILAPDADNTSEHLPIKMGVVLSVPTDGHRSLKHEADNMCFPKLSWDNFDMIDNYTTFLQSNLETLSPYDPSQCIDTYIDKLNYLLHDAAMRAGGWVRDCLNPNRTGALSWAVSGAKSVFGGIYGTRTGDPVTVLYMNVIKVWKYYLGR